MFEYPVSQYRYKDCYWAGFIAADGCVYKRPSRQSTFQMELHEKDFPHLKRLASFLGHYGTYYMSRNCISFRIASNELVHTLKTKFNIVPRKSKILKPPKLQSQKCRLSFIKGFIDGDGCIYTKKGRRDNPVLRIFSGSKFILNWIKKEIESAIKDKIPDIRNEPNNNYSLNVSGKKSEKFLLKLKKMSTPYLPRKWSKI